MSDKLNLSLPERKQGWKPSSSISLVLQILMLLLVSLVLYRLSSEPKSIQNHAGSNIAPATQKELALKLQKQGLDEQAANTWQAYLGTANLPDNESANIWYQIGQLRQSSGAFGPALESYYRAEILGVSEDVKNEIGRRTAQCLESLGKFSALRYELAGRVGLNKDDKAVGEDVVAEIGPQKITRADLDQRVEAEIDRQLQQMAAFLPEEQRKEQKEEMLKRFSSNEARMQLVTQMVAEEVLYRKARESKLAETPEVQDLVRDTERKLLAQQAMEKELSSKVNITPGDVQTFYDANKARYVRPERVRVAYASLSSEDEARKIQSALDAGQAMKDAAGAAAQETWVEKGRGLPALALAAEKTDALFTVATGQRLSELVATEKGQLVFQVLEKKAEEQRPFEEARQEVYGALRRQKEQEAQTQLLEELKQQYNVVIHTAQFVPEKKVQDLSKDQVQVQPTVPAAPQTTTPAPAPVQQPDNAPQAGK